MKKALGWFCILALAAILGGLAGELLAHFLPKDGWGWLREAATRGITLNLAPYTLDAKALALTFGAKVKLTAFSALGAVLGGFIFYRYS